MKTKKILLVDDEKAVTETLALFLEMEGHQVICAQSGSEAIEKYKEFGPEVILLDLNMPDMDGFDVSRELENLGADSTLVALSGDSRDGVVERAREAGFQHHLMKPSSPDELRKLLAELSS